MDKHTITSVSLYRSAFSEKHVNEHMNEILAKTTKIVNIGDGSVISIRNAAGLSRHALPIMIPANDDRNTFHKNLFLLDTFGLKDAEANFMYTATVLSAIWEDITINETYNSVNRLAMGLYIQWLGGGYSRQFGLDNTESDNVKVVTGLYWILQGLTVEDTEIKSGDAYSMIRKIADATSIPDKDVKSIIDRFDLISGKEVIDFGWFTKSLEKVSEILAYRMNPVSAVTIVSNSWYRGMVAPPQMALNYKPFFIAMIYTAFNDRSAARTGIDTLIKNTLEGRRRQQAETFVKAIEGIMRDQIQK